MFGAANGDDIEKTFTSMGTQHSFITRIYMYTAVILFANVVVRIFLSGIQYFVFLQVPQMEVEQVAPPADHTAHHGDGAQHARNGTCRHSSSRHRQSSHTIHVIVCVCVCVSRWVE
jgi:hypothetical protein